MEKNIRTYIRLLGITHNEIILNMNVNDYNFNTIEWDQDTGDIILHEFDDDLDIPYYFEDIDEFTKIKIHDHLLRMCSL